MSRPIHPRRRKQRPDNYSEWVNAPLQNLIRDELNRRDWTISDLGRAIDSQTSLISRWMQGQRPNPESLALIADALGIDILRLFALAEYIPADLVESGDERTVNLMAVLRQIEMSDERHMMLFTLMEKMRLTPLSDPQRRPADREERTG